MNFLELPVRHFVVTNLNTGKTAEFGLDFEKADKYLHDMRFERPDATWEMTAVIDA